VRHEDGFATAPPSPRLRRPTMLRSPGEQSRRQFLAGCIAAGAALPAFSACSGGGSASYENAMTTMVQPIAVGEPRESARLRDLVRQATLAASSHNTQPWKFRIEEQSITILPDLTRRCPIVDPDDHHLFVSLGCAAENLVHAARAGGLHADVDTQPHRIRVTLEETAAVRSPLFDAIPHRQCSRSIYDGRSLSPGDLATLERAARSDNVDVMLLTERPQLETVLDYVALGNTAQIGDPAFVKEPRHGFGSTRPMPSSRATGCSLAQRAIPPSRDGLATRFSGGCSRRSRRMRNARRSFAVRRESPSSSPPMTRYTGSTSGAAMSGSRCRPRRSASARRF
jgi:hypothetical protein